MALAPGEIVVGGFVRDALGRLVLTTGPGVQHRHGELTDADGRLVIASSPS